MSDRERAKEWIDEISPNDVDRVLYFMNLALTKKGLFNERCELKKEIESQKRVINGMIDNEEQYCLEINKLNNKINKLEETLAKIKDLNTMKYLRDDIFKDMLNEILKGSDKND